MTPDEIRKRMCDHAREDTSKPCQQCPKRRYLEVPAELVDGSHSTILDMDDPNVAFVLYDMMRGWFDDADPGDKSESFGIVEMSDEEVDALPEI